MDRKPMLAKYYRPGFSQPFTPGAMSTTCPHCGRPVDTHSEEFYFVQEGYTPDKQYVYHFWCWVEVSKNEGRT